VSKFKKIIKWVLISIAIIIALIIGTGLVIANFYGDEVKSYVIEELNQYIKTEISVTDINFSVLKKFPNASLELTDVVAMSTDEFNKNNFKKRNTDTLFTAKSLFLQFNIIDIIKKNYKLKTIDVDKGSLNIYIDNKGNDNFHFWKESSSTNSNFELQLKKLIFNNISLRFVNIPKGVELETFTSYLDLSGDFASGNYQLGTNGTFKIHKFKFDDINYFVSKNVELDLNLDVKNNYYNIHKGNLKVEGILFNISGNIITGETSDINLEIKGKDINVKSFISLLPDKYKNKINDFNSNGIFYFNSSIIGKSNSIKTPHIEINFGVENGEIEKRNSSVKLTNVNITGIYSNGSRNNISSSYLYFNNFDIKMGNSQLTGNCKMENLKRPKIELIAEAKIELKELHEFFEFDTIENISGLIQTNFKFKGRLNSINEFTVKDFRRAKTEGKLNIKNGQLKIENNDYDFLDIYGDFTFKNNDIRIDSIRMIVNENDIFIHGFFKNILSYILVKDQNLIIDGYIKSKSIDIEKLFVIGENDLNKNEGYNFPDNIILNTKVTIDKFKFNRFKAENVHGTIYYRNKTLNASPLHFNTMTGNLKTTGTIAQNTDNTFTTKFVTELKNIDVEKLFYTFKDFGQNFIRQEHLKGKVSSNINFSSNWSDKFEVNEKSIIADGNINIRDGELVDFEPIERLSKYIALEELRHIKFSTLENDIFIKDRKITIPQMEIISTAAEIELSGEHTFDNHILYRVKILLSDVLSKKAKKSKKENNEFGVIEDDGLGRTSLYLSITGTTDDYKITYDTKKVKDHIKQSLKEEKQNLKSILNEEFGWFKNDSTIIRNNQNNDDNSNTNFSIIWDEEEEEPLEEEEDDDDW